MSLVKSPELTPEKLAANQVNGRQSQGPATPEGVERIRAANTRHGYYSKAPGAEMHLLGEDKKEFEQFCQSVMEAWEPEGDYQEGLVTRMARLMWRLERGDRIQEAMAVSQMQALDRNMTIQGRLAAASHDRVVARLKALMQAIDGNHFCSTPRDRDEFEQIYGADPKGVGLEILHRLYRLQSPKCVETEEAKEAAADGLTIATHPAERDELRAELRDLLRGEIQRVDLEYDVQRSELEVTTAWRDSMMAPRHPQAGALVRQSDADLRQLRFLTDMLMKHKARGKKGEAGDGKAA